MSTDDLPAQDPERLAVARPWRERVWDRVPRWARIGVISVLALAAIHVVAGIRIWYGLQDPPEVAIMRRPGSEVWYRDQMTKGTEIQRLTQMALMGLRGRTADDVVRIIPGYQTSDEGLQYVARHFPNLRMIHLVDTPISSQGLLALKDCHELYHIDATDTRVDDGVAELLPSLPKLELLWLAWTDVGDKFAAAAAKHPGLQKCSIRGTRISAEAQAAWRQEQPACLIDGDDDLFALRGTLSWVDGQRTHFCGAPMSIELSGPRDPLSPTGWGRRTESEFRNKIEWSSQDMRVNGDGEFQAVVLLKLRKAGSHRRAPLEIIRSEPATFVVTDGKPNPSQLEFRMPIDRIESIDRHPRNPRFQ